MLRVTHLSANELFLQARFGGSGVGGATGVLVCCGAGWNFIGHADFRGCDFCYGEIRGQLVWLVGIFAGVVANDQGRGFLPGQAPFCFRADTRKTAADHVPKIEGMLGAFRCYDGYVLTQVSFTQQQSVPGSARAASFVTVISRHCRLDGATLLLAERCVYTPIRLRFGLKDL